MYKLKQMPEDFRVKENLPLKTTGISGKYCYFIMKKKDWTTVMALYKIAERLRVNPRVFAVGGMKDKKGITEQHVSAYGVKWDKLKRIKVKDISFQFVGYGKDPIRLGSVRANEFLITVRNLEKPLSPIKSMCNYYDDQRFGGIRPNAAEVGKQLLKSDFEEAMKSYLTYPYPDETPNHKSFRENIRENWGDFSPKMVPGYLPNERKALAHLQKHKNDYIGAFRVVPKQIATLFIHAYQSLLFNRLLTKLVSEEEHYNISYCFGKLPATETYFNKKLPLVGYDYEGDDSDVREVLEQDGITTSSFKSEELPFLNSRTIQRNASVKIGNLKLKDAEKDELNPGKLKQKVCFSLESGSYATMAVKHMFHKPAQVN